MSVSVLRNIILPSVCEREVLRYAGVRGEDCAASALLKECISESEGLILPSVCYTELLPEVKGDICSFGSFSVSSHALAARLQDSCGVLVFCATVGVGIDRLVTKYTRLSPARALMLSSLGTERAEAVCDVFARIYSKQTGAELTGRFSPGYGDLPLECQADIFRILDPHKNIGVALGGSLLMTPAKSVTAFAGILRRE